MHVVFVHPDFPERHLELVDDVTVFAEDGAMLGSMPDAALARAFADQAYVLVFRSDHGAYVCAAGDRRLVAVNGTPQLYAPLREGDTVEFGHTVLVVQGD